MDPRRLSGSSDPISTIRVTVGQTRQNRLLTPSLRVFWRRKIVPLGFQMSSKIPDKLLFSSLISFFFVFLSQFSLFLLVYFFPSLSLLPMLLLSALLLIFGAAFGRLCRRLLRISAFPPAFVFFSIVFLWGVYVYAIREGISFLKDVIVNVEFVLLTISLYRIINSDPGLVTTEYSCVNRSDLSALVDEVGLSTINGVTNEPPVKIQSPLSFERVRYCKICKAFIKGFDHHCPAFGNCIGKNNHLLFTILLIGFIIAEASYVACSTQFITRSKNSVLNGLESSLARNLATSTLLFSLLQVLWQMVFLVWHIHCICFNIKTDEWINWRRYPEFQLVVRPQPGQHLSEIKFTNPYNRGIINNLKEFMGLKEYNHLEQG